MYKQLISVILKKYCFDRKHSDQNFKAELKLYKEYPNAPIITLLLTLFSIVLNYLDQNIWNYVIYF